MNTDAMRAAFRILTSTPAERIHRYERDWDAVERENFNFKDGSHRYDPAKTRALHRRILELKDKKPAMSQVQIAAELGVHPVTVSKHLTGKIRTVE